MSLMDFGLIIGGGYAISLLLERTGITDYLYNSLQGRTSVSDSEYELLIGYSGKFIKTPIKVNMLDTPHILIAGLSGSGKSKMIEFMLKDKQVILINAFKGDLPSLKCRRITGNEKILNYLSSLLDNPYRREKPLYIAIDECLVLCRDKAIEKKIAECLAVCRHYNIFFILATQEATKEVMKFKNLCNTRICMRQLEESSFHTCLGCTVEDKFIRKREFYVVDSEGLRRGRTYDL